MAVHYDSHFINALGTTLSRYAQTRHDIILFEKVTGSVACS